MTTKDIIPGEIVFLKNERSYNPIKVLENKSNFIKGFYINNNKEFLFDIKNIVISEAGKLITTYKTYF